MDILTLTLAKQYTNLVAMGLASVSVDDTEKTITFTLAEDGSEHTLHFSEPTDGVSPEVAIEAITGGHRLTIIDTDHPDGQTVDIMDGLRGPQGDQGEQGEKGETGEAGKGIVSLTLLSGDHSAGTSDTYRLAFTDGTHVDFLVYNGADGLGSTLNSLNDVEFNNLQDKNIIYYDAITHHWINGVLPNTAIINVSTNDDDLVGQTITLKLDGETINTAKMKSDKTCRFVVHELGEYVVDAGDYLAEVDVDSPYRSYDVSIVTSMSIPITIVGATEDTITVTKNGVVVGTCVFESGQSSGEVEVIVPINGASVPLTFESSVAKDITTGRENYSKTVDVNKNTSTVKVMPDNVIYWFGNEVRDIVQYDMSAPAHVPPVAETNYYFLNPNTFISPYYEPTLRDSGIRTSEPLDVTTFIRLKMIVRVPVSRVQYGGSYNIPYSDVVYLEIRQLPTSSTGAKTYYESATLHSQNTILEVDISDATGEMYAMVCAYIAAQVYVCALWFE